MAVQAFKVAFVSVVPNNSHWGACGLRISYAEISDSLHSAEHAFFYKWVFQ
jgi:hypothetical protein